MGAKKKGKGKKGKKGGKKGKKGKKSKEPQMTAQEAILAYQINVIEKKLEDVMYETRGWDEKNKRHLDRNDKLKEEQEVLIRHLLKQAKDADRLFAGEEIKSKDDVIVVMQEKWARQRAREQQIEDLRKKIAQTEAEIAAIQKDVDYWTRYKDDGQYVHATQIRALEQEVDDMTTSFNEMKEPRLIAHYHSHLDSSLEKTKAEIDKFTIEKEELHKHQATQKAMNQMDKYSRQEVLDNDWLKREVEIHRRETDDLRKEVEEIERGNLEIMADLFECKIEDLKISRNFFLTQFAEGENLDTDGILEMDLAQLSIDQPARDQPLAIMPARPQSATHRAVQDKVFSLIQASIQSDEEDDSDADSDDTELLDNMFYEEEDWGDYLQLGPLELKLLNVTGTQMTIHSPPTLDEEELKVKDCNPEDWPVTQPMLKDLVTPRGLAT
ncbi:coiled-coil domain-containing protein 83-like isoform X2 [Dreissena polymorpha]|uniref:coiled-coil domain-containing protein 83-like isoform X2 n=1 Tax=Dreissena polymorpha TaxID=45954 RepID=UPI0022647EA9|nr:coiled-coil domain-containing protein 83-like isoform X2 [Dreissena polymorpha]